MTIEVGNATGLRLILRNCLMSGPENNNAINVGTIKNLTLENLSAAVASCQVTSAATRTLLIGGTIYDYQDNSITTRINYSDVAGTTGIWAENFYANGVGGVSASGEISNEGQVGPFGFIACSSAGLPRVGGYDYDATTILPLNLYATMVQMPTSTTAALSAVANAINTNAGKIAGTIVFDTTANIPMYATGSADASTWVGEKAGSTVTLTPA
jgi:hypothetical protein